jgi:alpha-amylase/alpha-mannosidase (GH57 family)
MKIWNSYGSEHSAQLVLIGRFKTIADADGAHRVLTEINDYMRTHSPELFQAVRYPPEFQALLEGLKIHNLSVHEIDQFSYEVHATLKEDEVRISTNEPDISAYLKVMVDRGAKVEVFTTLSYPEDDKE